MFAGLNWIDWTIIVMLLYYALQGWQAGFADLGLSFVTFLTSLWLAIKFHAPVGDFLSQKFGIPTIWSAVLGYIIVAFIAQAILWELVQLVLTHLPKKLISSKLNSILGSTVSLFNGIVLIAFLLLVIDALPLRGTVKNDVQSSVVGNFLTTTAKSFGGPIQSTINQVRQDMRTFVTIEPGSTESLKLDISPKESELQNDVADEQRMVVLVNAERAKVGAPKLTMDAGMVAVARAHSRDMLLRQYFSHLTPEGLTAGGRLLQAGIDFTKAGENIAYAPDLTAAHEGLINSPGHRQNILDPSFHRIGIGIIATDTWGMMFTQDFAN